MSYEEEDEDIYGFDVTKYPGLEKSKGCFVGDHCLIKKAYIGKCTIIHDCVELGSDVDVHDGSIINNACKIGDNTTIGRGVVLNNAVVVGQNCILEDGVYIGDGVTIGESCILRSGCHVEDGACVESETIVPRGFKVERGSIFSKKEDAEAMVSENKLLWLSKHLKLRM
jgi:UDP-3-O-[3-hydroxymyristoyl] glucosamine N-acyltransferase